MGAVGTQLGLPPSKPKLWPERDRGFVRRERERGFGQREIEPARGCRRQRESATFRSRPNAKNPKCPNV